MTQTVVKNNNIYLQTANILLHLSFQMKLTSTLLHNQAHKWKNYTPHELNGTFSPRKQSLNFETNFYHLQEPFKFYDSANKHVSYRFMTDWVQIGADNNISAF